MVEMITYDPEIFNETWNKISNVTEKRMKKYRVETEDLPIQKGTELTYDDSIAGVEYRSKEHGWFIGRQAIQWDGFTPVEEEVKEGDYIYLIHADEEWSVSRLIGDHEIADDHYKVKSLSGEEGAWDKKSTRKATKDEIETALIAEAKRRGLVHGTKIISASRNNFKATVCEPFKYKPESDTLIDTEGLGHWIYHQGKFAETIDEPIQINGNEVFFDDNANYFKVGCRDIYKKDFGSFSTLVITNGLKVSYKGEDITKQIKQIADKL